MTARILALVFFAAAYKNWIFLVVALHWLCMFLWNLIQTWVSFIENINTYITMSKSVLCCYHHRFNAMNFFSFFPGF